VTYLANNDGKLETGDASGWLVTDTYDGGNLQRYCISSTAHGAVTGYSASSYAHYTTSAGYVVRGTYDTGAGCVYVANNDGKLLSTSNGKSGWVVTGAYDGGVLQRYYYNATTHAAQSGFFTVAGYGNCFGLANLGYVLRGKTNWGTTVLLADNDGKLATGSGWLVTGKYDGGTLQRYYLVDAWSDYVGAKTGLFEVSGSWYYGLSGVGYMLRNATVWSGRYLFRANNDGELVVQQIACSYVSQYDVGASMGCEGTALYMALRSLGYLQGWSLTDFLNTTPIAADDNPNHGFSGSPWTSTSGKADGMLPPAVVSWGSTYGTCTNISGCSASQLVAQVQQGHPVVVWTSVNFRSVHLVDTWYGTAPDNWHVMTLIGYNATTKELLVADPAGEGEYWVSWDTFMGVWTVFRGAVAVS
jgi:uncharacterized protein YvpB